MPSICGRAVVAVALAGALSLGDSVRGQDAGKMMVADFENGKVETTQGLALVVIADEQIGGTSDAQMSVIHPGAEGTRGGAHITYRITDGFATPFDGVWAPVGAQGVATDLTAYRGVRFLARSKDGKDSKGGQFYVGVAQFSGQAMLYLAPFEAKPEWTVIELTFDKFRRSAPTGAPVGGDGPDSTLVPTKATSIGFNISGKLRGQFDLDIDQLQLYR